MITLSGKFIDITFAYNPILLEVVRSIPGRIWCPEERIWRVPATSYHAAEVKKQFEQYMRIDPSVVKLAKVLEFDRTKADPEPYKVGDYKPYPSQAVAVPFLESVNGRGLLCDEVGVGKTIEALIFARYKKCQKILCIAPASVTYKWRTEFERWYPEVNPQVIPNGKTPITSDVLILSWSMMTRLGTVLSKRDWDLIIMDEFHAIKSYKAQRTKMARIISSRARYIVGLSGTPLLNKPNELFNMLNVLDPVAWTFPNYMKRYCFNGFDYQGAYHLDELEKRIQPFMLRRYKKDMTDLPRITRTFVPVDIDMSIYNKVFREDPTTLNQLFGKPYFTIDLEWTMALKQVIETAKSDLAVEWADDFLYSTDKKLVIYCSYLPTIAYLKNALKEYGTYKIVGSVSQKDRASTIARWQSQNTERVMLLTYAGGQGIDLFGLNGIDISTLLFVGREWNPASEEQIEGRLDRNGQTFPVQAVYLLARNTIDVKVNDLVNSKREIIRQAVGNRDIPTVESDLLSFLEQSGGYRRKERHAKTK